MILPLWSRLLCVLFCLAGPGVSAAKGSCLSWGVWKKELKQQRLWLPMKTQARLIKRGNGTLRPSPSALTRPILSRYGKVLAFVQRKRKCVARRYRRARTNSAKRRVLWKIQKLLMKWLDQQVLPLWIGTPWAFYGSAERPHQKAVACGYFVTHALIAAGFFFPESRLVPRVGDPGMREFAFAKLTSYGMMKLLSSRRHWKVRNHRHPMSRLMRTLRRLGRGIYLLGLDSHVGLVLWDGKRASFWHSDFSTARLWVHREPLHRAPVVLASRYRHIARLPLRTYLKWLLARPIKVHRRRRRR